MVRNIFFAFIISIFCHSVLANNADVDPQQTKRANNSHSLTLEQALFTVGNGISLGGALIYFLHFGDFINVTGLRLTLIKTSFLISSAFYLEEARDWISSYGWTGSYLAAFGAAMLVDALFTSINPAFRDNLIRLKPFSKAVLLFQFCALAAQKK